MAMIGLAPLGEATLLCCEALWLVRQITPVFARPGIRYHRRLCVTCYPCDDGDLGGSKGMYIGVGFPLCAQEVVTEILRDQPCGGHAWHGCLLMTTSRLDSVRPLLSHTV